jgi:hypothetical protein
LVELVLQVSDILTKCTLLRAIIARCPKCADAAALLSQYSQAISGETK